MNPTVGFIGLGMMGCGMAKHTLQKGFPVALLIRKPQDAERCAELIAAGAQTFNTVAEVAAASDIVIICVTGSPQVEDVVFSEQGILAGLKPGTVVVDCSTSMPESTRRVAAAIVAKGGKFLDAAMTGTPKDADEGQINLLVGGDAALLETVRPVFECFAKNVFHCGATGAGHSIKLLHQFVVLGNAAILGEAFSCAKKAEVNLAVLCDVIASGGANSTAFARLRPYILEGNDQMFRFSMANVHKDMHYYTRMAGDARAASFIGAAVYNAYTVAGNLGFSQAFVPHVVNVFDIINGVKDQPA